MSDEDKESKTENATAKRRQDAEKKGQFAKSKEFNQAAVLVLGMGGVVYLGGYWGTMVKKFSIDMFLKIDGMAPDSGAVITNAFAASVQLLWDIFSLPFILLWILVVFFIFWHQRFLIPEDSLKFDIQKLNPISGFKEKFFSLGPVVEFVKSIFKLSLLGYVAYRIMSREWSELPSVVYFPLQSVLYLLKELVAEIFWS